MKKNKWWFPVQRRFIQSTKLSVIQKGYYFLLKSYSREVKSNILTLNDGIEQPDIVKIRMLWLDHRIISNAARREKAHSHEKIRDLLKLGLLTNTGNYKRVMGREYPIYALSDEDEQRYYADTKPWEVKICASYMQDNRISLGARTLGVLIKTKCKISEDTAPICLMTSSQAERELGISKPTYLSYRNELESAGYLHCQVSYDQEMSGVIMHFDDCGLHRQALREADIIALKHRIKGGKKTRKTDWNRRIATG